MPESHPRSLERLAAALATDVATPLVLRGATGSGRSAVVRQAAERAGLELFEYEAVVLVADIQRQVDDGAWADADGMRNRLDEVRAVAALRDGTETLFVIDHLDAVAQEDRRGVMASIEWLAARVHVVGVAEPRGFRTPPAWRTVNHSVADVQRFWDSARTRLHVIQGGIDL